MFVASLGISTLLAGLALGQESGPSADVRVMSFNIRTGPPTMAEPLGEPQEFLV